MMFLSFYFLILLFVVVFLFVGCLDSSDVSGMCV